MRFKLTCFALVIFLCAIGVSNSGADTIQGTCASGGIYCACEPGHNPGMITGINPYPNCNTTSQTTIDAACVAANPGVVCISAGGGGGGATPAASVVMNSVDNLNGIPVAKGTGSGSGIVGGGFYWWIPPTPANGFGGSESGWLPANGGGVGEFSLLLTGLKPSTTYHIKAYIMVGGFTRSSDEILFTTGPARLPAVITKPDFTVNDREVLVKGEITDVGTSLADIYGFVYATHPNPTVWDRALAFAWDTTLPIYQGKTFEGTLKGFIPGKYYFRAYAHNSQGTAYGEEFSFTIPGNIDATAKYAWSENAGWLNFNSLGGVSVFSDHLEGYAWHENIGWIKLGTFIGGTAHTYSNESNTDYGVNNDGIGNLSGYGWSENAGWINFRPVLGGVIVYPNGDMSGYAWGESIGWIHFANTTPAYKVTAKWLSGATLYPVTLNTAGNGQGTTGVSGSSFLTGQTVNLTAVPDIHSVFAGWSPAPCAAGFNMPGSALSCTATFNAKTYTVTVNKAGAGGGTVSSGGSFIYGTAVKPTATPDSNSVFAGWSPAQCGTGFNMPDSDMTCTATFDVKLYKLTLKTDGTGTGTVSGGGNFAYGTGISLYDTILSVASGSKLKSWSPSPCADFFNMPNYDLSCTATFDKVYNITLKTAGTGNGTFSSLSITFQPHFSGETISLPAAQPSSDSTFAGWSGCSASFSMPASDTTCTAVFNLKPSHTLTVNKAGTGNGTVSGSGVYPEGTNLSVYIKATPDANSFQTDYSCPQYMPASDLTCTVTFKKIYNLTVNKAGSGNGTVNVSGGFMGGGTFIEGHLAGGSGKGLTINAVADDNSYFIGWSPTICADMASGKVVTMTASDLTCTATFRKYYQVSVLKTGDGEGTVSGGGRYKEGDSVTPKAVTPLTGSKFMGWDNPMCADTFKMPASDVSCTAQFSKTYSVSVRYIPFSTGTLGSGWTEGERYYLPGESVMLVLHAYKGSMVGPIDACVRGCSDWTYDQARVWPDCRVDISYSYLGATFTDKMPSADVECGVYAVKSPEITEESENKASSSQPIKKKICSTCRANERDDPTVALPVDTAFTSFQFSGGTGAVMFRKPVSSVTLQISDNSGDTTLTAYGANDVVLKTIPVIGATLQAYTIDNVGDILKVVVSSSNAYVEDISYDTEIVPGDTDFDGDSTLTDTIIMLRVLSGLNPGATIYPEISLNRKQVTLEDVIVNLQKVAGVR